MTLPSPTSPLRSAFACLDLDARAMTWDEVDGVASVKAPSGGRSWHVVVWVRYLGTDKTTRDP